MIYELTDKTLPEFLALIRDASPSSGTHWSRCRGPQRIYAHTWLDTFDAKRRARNQARRTQAAIYIASGIVLFYTILAIKTVLK